MVCPCNRKLKLSDQFRGRKIQCFCKRRFRVSKEENPILLDLDGSVAAPTDPSDLLESNSAVPTMSGSESPAPLDNSPSSSSEEGLAVQHNDALEFTNDPGASVEMDPALAGGSGIGLDMDPPKAGEIAGMDLSPNASLSPNMESGPSLAVDKEKREIAPPPMPNPSPSPSPNPSPNAQPARPSSGFANADAIQAALEEKGPAPAMSSATVKDPLSFDAVSRKGERPETRKIEVGKSPMEVLKSEKSMKIIHQARVYSQIQDGWFHCYLTGENKDMWGYCGMEKKDVRAATGLGMILGVVSLLVTVFIFKLMGISAIIGFFLALLVSGLLYSLIFFWKRPYGYLTLFRDNEREDKSLEIVQTTKLPIFSCNYEVRDNSNDTIGTLAMSQINGVLQVKDADGKPVAVVKAKNKIENIIAMLSGRWFFQSRSSYAISLPGSPLPFANFDSFIDNKEYGRLEIGAPGSAIDPRLFHAFVLMVEYDR